jgi:endonuclease III
MNKTKREQIFARLQAANPNPETELKYQSPFELLIAVMLSAQATDVSVNKATRKLFPIANTPQAIVDLGIDNLRDHIKSIGLFNSKAENIIKTCNLLIEQHHSVIPDNLMALQELPGVGRKTANVILNTAFRQPAMAVDTHIFRVSNRTRIATGKNVLEVEAKLLRHVPKKYLLDAHHWLILHGRYICTARKPKCSACIIADLCEFNEKLID